jgi:hypothetical protein
MCCFGAAGVVALFQAADEFGAIDITFDAGLLNVHQQYLDLVDCFEDQRDDVGRERALSGSGLGEDVFGDMRGGAEQVEAEEATRSLDRVDRAKDAGDKRVILRRLFEFDDLVIERGEVFVALDEELANVFVPLLLFVHIHTGQTSSHMPLSDRNERGLPAQCRKMEHLRVEFQELVGKGRNRAKPEPQRLKPHCKYGIYGTAEAVPLSKTGYSNKFLSKPVPFPPVQVSSQPLNPARALPMRFSERRGFARCVR